MAGRFPRAVPMCRSSGSIENSLLFNLGPPRAKRLSADLLKLDNEFSVLSQNPFDDLSIHVGQPEVTPLIAEGKAFVIDP